MTKLLILLLFSQFWSFSLYNYIAICQWTTIKWKKRNINENWEKRNSPKVKTELRKIWNKKFVLRHFVQIDISHYYMRIYSDEKNSSQSVPLQISIVKSWNHAHDFPFDPLCLSLPGHNCPFEIQTPGLGTNINAHLSTYRTLFWIFFEGIWFHIQRKANGPPEKLLPLHRCFRKTQRQWFAHLMATPTSSSFSLENWTETH